MNEKMKTKLKGYGITCAFPVGMGIVMELICLIFTGNHILISAVDVSSFIKNVFILTCSGIALSMGMRSGRMDFSLGAQRLIACLVGCNIALRFGLSGVWVLIFAIAFGMLAGAISGCIFLALKIPSMVCGLGVTLIFESIAFLFTGGEGVRFFGNADLYILSDTWFVVLVCMIALCIVTFLFSKTTFGFHYQAIRGNQKIAFNSGIRVYANVFISYLIAGGLMGISGVLDTVYKGSMSAATGMGTVAVAFYSIVNVIIAMHYSRYMSIPAAILLVTIGLQFMSSCITSLHINSYGANAIQMIFLLLFAFVTYMMEQKKQKRLIQKRIEEADRLWNIQMEGSVS